MGKYTPVRMVSDIINVPTLSVLVPVLNYGPLVIIQNVYSATTCCLHFSPHTTILLEVVVLLLLVLYYSVLGVTMVAYVDAHRVSMGNTTAVPVLHMPNQLNVQDGVVPVQLCAQLPAHERHQPAAHEPAADATGLVEHDYTRTMRRAMAGHGPGRRSEAVRSALAARMCF